MDRLPSVYHVQKLAIDVPEATPPDWGSEDEGMSHFESSGEEGRSLMLIALLPNDGWMMLQSIS